MYTLAAGALRARGTVPITPHSKEPGDCSQAFTEQNQSVAQRGGEKHCVSVETAQKCGF